MNIEKYDTVSFDIFDTLVSRRIYRPADLFSLMQIEIANNSNILLPLFFINESFHFGNSVI